MSSSPDACPSPETLEAIAGGMTVDTAVMTHLRGCPACAAALARLREANDLFDEVRGLEFGGDDLREDLVPGYRLIREIHRGGQGVVWLAEQDGTRRSVAIKMLLQGRFATSRQRRRFEREIEVVASLDDVAIVTVFESGVTGDGQVYCAMEYVDGVPLDEWFRENASDRDRTIRLVHRIATAIGVAHRRGVIHRDLKPANILVDADGQPHVLDFGLARLENERDSERAELLATVSGEFLGTFTYCAPEQLTGDPTAVDTRADVYALGLLLFEGLTGTRPFENPDSIADLVHQRVDQTAPKPSSRSRGIGRELDLIVLKSLDVDPDRRYDTGGALAEDLANLQAGRVVRARGDGFGYLLWKAVQRHKLPASFAAILLILVVASSIVMALLYRESEQRRRQAERVEAAIVESFTYLNPEQAGTMDIRLPGLIAALERTAVEQLSEEPVVQSRVLRLAGDSYCNLEMIDEAARCFDRVFALERSRLEDGGPPVPALATAYHDLGRVHYFRAQRAAREAAAAEAAGESEAAEVHSAVVAEEYGIAEESYRAAIDLRRRTPGVDAEDLAMSLQHLGSTILFASNQRRMDEVTTLFEEALRIREATPSIAPELVATSWNSLAVLYGRQSEYDLALDAATRAVRLAASDEISDAWAGRFSQTQAINYVRLGRHAEAIAAYESALDRCRRVYGDDSPIVRRIQERLARSLLIESRPTDARRVATAALTTIEADDPARIDLHLLCIDADAQEFGPGPALQRLDRGRGNDLLSLEDQRVDRRRRMLVDWLRNDLRPDAAVVDELGASILERWAIESRRSEGQG